MSSVAESPDSGAPVQAAPEEDERFVGVVTRATSWMLDAIAINVVAIVAGLGVQLILSIFPISTSFASLLIPIAAVVYGVWCGAYFVVSWSLTGQTLGAQAMQIRLLTANRGRVKPARAVVRWVGMNLAMVPLFAGFAPILFGRRGFPDWLARTVVVQDPQLSRAQARRATLRRARDGSRGLPPAISPESESSASASGHGSGPLETHRDGSRGGMLGRAEPTS
jgi:uncharacterized RDD family membrane protein YckC